MTDNNLNAADDTGFKSDANFYSILNLPQNTSIKGIEKQFRKLSRSIHPDK